MASVPTAIDDLAASRGNQTATDRKNYMAVRLLKRSKRFGVGKQIGGAVYVHRQYESKLGAAVAEAKRKLSAEADYQVVKYNYLTGAVSFVQSPDFDTAPEPTVGGILIVDSQGQIRRRRQASDPEIYHHKWLFVADDFQGFDVEQSKQRSLAWTAIDGVDRKRIGKKSYWELQVLPRLSTSASRVTR